ncbi:hypothetical protein RJ639_006542 [Escallonia herrerae]|uniref:DNA-repair protein Xrcc1 N-terminal domain-containing protein n=1 Tax=Escallonia herrerae TaxID=1293975 RepID=A0AA88VXH2_9ASTE|nr:hypothetical protein RJ639_006542 [Escallonia herrerae]
MDVTEVEPRVKPLPYKVKATSRESPAQKASHLLDTDLRNHWSTATNTKEWILLELDELEFLCATYSNASCGAELAGQQDYRRVPLRTIEIEFSFLARSTPLDLASEGSCRSLILEAVRDDIMEPCLLSHIRIYNKSVLEWEISVGLRYKPETFVKLHPRCEAPRREMIYPMNYTPCRYVRISCLRGNPIAIFFIQLIGVTVTGLEPEFQPVVNYLLPYIISHKKDAHDMHLQLLQDVTNRLVAFLPQLEADLNSLSDTAEPYIRFLAMLAGPFYPILNIVKERLVHLLIACSCMFFLVDFQGFAWIVVELSMYVYFMDDMCSHIIC